MCGSCDRNAMEQIGREPYVAPPPLPEVCGICGRRYYYEYDQHLEAWDLETAWWTAEGYAFLCGRRCWLKARGYTWNEELQRYVSKT